MRFKELIVKESMGSNRPEIYLDMDGVLADFFHEYAKLAGVKPNEFGRHDYRSIPPAKTDPTLNKMVGTDFFARLPTFPTTDAVVNMAVKVFGHYNICSSPLRGDHENSEKQKKIWIGQNLDQQPKRVIITSNKAKYAVQPDGTPNILIDDRGSNITSWENAGGIGIKYQADEDSLDVIKQGLKRAFKIIHGKMKHEPQQLVSKDRSLPVATDKDQEVAEHKTDPKLCRSSKRLGRSDYSSCVAQGLKPHQSKGKGHTDGNGQYLKGHKAKSVKYGGTVPDYS